MPCTSCLEARRKLLAARTAREAAQAVAEAVRINAGKAKEIMTGKDVGQIKDRRDGQS
jgi:hypothetical protein